MGLSRYVQDSSGRRASAISGTDGYFRGFAMSMAAAKPDDREKYREKWTAAIAAASNKKVVKGKASRTVMTASLIKSGALSDEQLTANAGAYGLSKTGNESATKAGWRKKKDGSIVIIYSGTGKYNKKKKGTEYTPEEYAQIKINEVNTKLGTNIK